MRWSFWLAEDLLASQEGLCSIALFSYDISCDVSTMCTDHCDVGFHLQIVSAPVVVSVSLYEIWVLYMCSKDCELKENTLASTFSFILICTFDRERTKLSQMWRDKKKIRPKIFAVLVDKTVSPDAEVCSINMRMCQCARASCTCPSPNNEAYEFAGIGFS
jgi:hypothetical protein